MELFINNLAQTQGLEFFGLVDLIIEEDYKRFLDFIEKGHHGSMAYLENHKEIRRSPQTILSGSNCAFIFGLNYFLGDKISTSNTQPQIAQYAKFKDYHKSVHRKIETIKNNLIDSGLISTGRTCVDSAPILERALAKKSIKGFIGKNTMFIHPQKGSYFLLGILIAQTKAPLPLLTKEVNIPFNKRDPDKGGCGTCRRCQVHCPTGALYEDYKLDARKCLAFLTIENRDTIPVTYWKHLGKYYFGCDLCQLACPYNRKASLASFNELKIKKNIPLVQIATMNQEEYVHHFGGTPLTRAKISGLRRNALIAMVVTKDPDLTKALESAPDLNDLLLNQTIQQIKDYEHLTQTR